MAALYIVGAAAPGIAAPEWPPNDEAPGVTAEGFREQGIADSPDCGGNRQALQRLPAPRTLTFCMSARVDEVLEAAEAHLIGQARHRAVLALCRLDRALLHGCSVVHPLNGLQDIVDEARDFQRQDRRAGV